MECYSLALITRTITIKDYDGIDPNDIRDAMLKELAETRKKIESLINVSGRGEEDIIRIQGAFLSAARKSGYYSEFLGDNDHPCANDFSPYDLFLSGALVSCGLCLMELKNRDFGEAFPAFSAASYFLGMAEGHDKTREISESELKNIFSRYAAILQKKDEVIDKYQQGTKSNAAATKVKWALANEYLKEEILRHRRINDARAAAAHKAGIGVATRRLIQMMPDPRKP